MRILHMPVFVHSSTLHIAHCKNMDGWSFSGTNVAMDAEKLPFLKLLPLLRAGWRTEGMGIMICMKYEVSEFDDLKWSTLKSSSQYVSLLE